MFSIAEKKKIAEGVEALLLSFNHSEMPTEKVRFELHIEGKEAWSWANIRPNWMHDDAGDLNERMDKLERR